jgi:hypothetical protein
MKRSFSLSRLALLTVLAAFFVLVSGRAFAQTDEDDEEEDSTATVKTAKPHLKKYFYKYGNEEEGRPLDFMIGGPMEIQEELELLGRENKFLSDSLLKNGMRAYQNGMRIYIDAMRPYIDMLHSEEDVDLLRLTDTTDFAKYKEIPELERKSFELTRAFHEATKATAKETVQKELENTLNKLFELRELRKEEEVKRIESDLEKTKAKMAERKLNKQIIVKRRMDQLLGKRDDLEW